MNKKILIVDDEKEIVDLLEVYLSNDGYSVYKCYNGLEVYDTRRMKYLYFNSM